ncbi:hypothetical protein ACFL9U_17915 [Thermodesulfobacteriota bacterium]
MAKYTARLRYYIGDALEEIHQEDLDGIAEAFAVKVTLERIDRRTPINGMYREETLGQALEDISQEVITVDAADEDRFRKAIIAVYEKYRSPRTPYTFWGSSLDGERIAKAVVEETGGGW